MKVFKYPLEMADSQTISVPRGAQLLTVQIQHNLATLWALCDPDAPLAPLEIDMVGTGYTAPENMSYLATVQWSGGSFVTHYFAGWVAK